jgi:hypothetical protein
MSFPLTGTCNCGAVVVEIAEPFLLTGYCHCTRCQRRTGAAWSIGGRVAPGAFRVVRGEELLRAWRPPTGAAKFFCGDCGSHMFSRTDAGGVSVRLGVLDGDPGVAPSFHQFTADAVSWEALPDDGLPRHPASRPA